MEVRLMCRTPWMALSKYSSGQLSQSRRMVCSVKSPHGFFSQGQTAALSNHVLDCMSTKAWDHLRSEAKKLAFRYGSFFCDEAIHNFRQKKKVSVEDIKNQLKALHAARMGNKSGSMEDVKAIRKNTCPFLCDTDLDLEETRCIYYLGLKEEARQEKLYLEYLVKEFKHWKWIVEFVKGDHDSNLFKFLDNECSFTSRRVVRRGLNLHKSRIPLDCLDKPLTREIREGLLAKINIAYEQVDTAIQQIKSPNIESMERTIESVQGFPTAEILEILKD